MKITFHPLFVAVGIASALFGGLPVFIICALTALLHECGHIFCASKMGYGCQKISLMPYGAAAVCSTDGIRISDEIKLALAGPVINAAVCLACAALWWFWPVTYAYTDTVFYANAAMLLFNLLPAYPLDGGRAAGCLLRLYFTPKTANITLRVCSLIVAAAGVILYFTVFKNLSLLVFSLFLACSAFEKNTPLSRIKYTPPKRGRGREIKEVMLCKNSTFKDALRYVDSGKYIIYRCFTGGVLDEICEEELFELLESHSIYDKVFSD